MNTRRHNTFLTVISGLLLIALSCAVIFISFEYYDLMSLQRQYNPDSHEISYQHHCAFITDHYDSALWDSVYQAAKEQGRKKGIYVEDFGKNLSLSYSTDDLLKMAISAKVDAIIVEATGNPTTRDLINEAAAKGIAVSTIYRDDMNSRRFSFTGINYFRMGYEYGELALKHSSGQDRSITVLLDKKESAPEQRLLISGIGKALQEKDADLKLETMTLDNHSTFDVEEQVREFMKESHLTTDILICTDLSQTQAVSQTAIDLNFVGDFTIIGFYQSRSVLEAIKNGVISANIMIDTKALGENAVNSLEEYLTFGHTSDFISVDTTTIGKQDAIQRLNAMDQTQKGGMEDEN